MTSVVFAEESVSNDSFDAESFLETTNLMIKTKQTFTQQDEQSLNLDRTMAWDDGTLIFNQGRAIETDIIEENVDQNQLFAVYTVDRAQENYQFYYFSNTHEVLEADILQSISDFQDKIPSDLPSNRPGRVASVPSGGVYKNYSWTVYFGNNEASYIYSSNHFKRASSNASINGVTGSVWDVGNVTTLERRGLYASIELTTKLNANYAGQSLLDYGPYTSSASSVTVGLSGLTPNVSWTTSTGGHVTNLSSASSKYGSWKFRKSTIGGLLSNPLTTKPGVQVSNVSGNMRLGISYSGKVGYALGDNFPSYSTGVVVPSIPDR